MSEQEKFTPTEWQTLQFAPFWAFSQVASIDGKIDKEEVAAFVKEIFDAPIYKSPFVREVLLSVAADSSGIMAAYQADPRTVTVGLTEVADLLAAKVDATESTMFKGAIIGIVMHVAQATGPRFSKDKVSKDEEMAINYIGMILRFDAAEWKRVAPTYQPA